MRSAEVKDTLDNAVLGVGALLLGIDASRVVVENTLVNPDLSDGILTGLEETKLGVVDTLDIVELDGIGF